MRKSFLESEERYLGDGFFPRKAEWFEFIEGAKFNNDWYAGNIMNFAFQMSLDTKQYSRSVYSILDFLGDVGGLLSILLPIGGAFIALIDELFSRTLDSYIITKVFFYRKKLKKPAKNDIVGEPNQQKKNLSADKNLSM